MTRWLYKAVHVPHKLFGGKQTERLQLELDKYGQQGWELVSVAHGHPAPFEGVHLYFKRPA